MHQNQSIPRLLVRLLTMACLCGSGNAIAYDQHPTTADDDMIQRFFSTQNKTVLSFIGYSGAGYENPDTMLATAQSVLREFDPARTIVNSGATKDGIGAIYELAKKMGFTTTGIVSTQAKVYHAELSPYVDRVFFVEDQAWGGRVGRANRLSPTSAAMVEYSDIMIGIGGGPIARDELTTARQLGKEVRFFAADMNHRRAIDKARAKGRPLPKDFSGAAADLTKQVGGENANPR